MNDCLGVRLLDFSPHTGDFREILHEDCGPYFYITFPPRIEDKIHLAEETSFSAPAPLWNLFKPASMQ